MAGMGPLLFQQLFGITEECCVEEAEPEIASKRTDDGDVAPMCRVAGVAPFDRFRQSGVSANLSQLRQPLVPNPC